ncbi:bifunctional riboflavin kinase/FAD synthetase [Rhizohabitans arisaemae]|uniref:bifunctional riboflavin kinase/FAD synthetase n=1 Tax=Rhizohabitans arisaemae TaxID=2720610 RepID=UPI0024B080E9|nr:bifunctional riboflavin kinase/FAD synthetase [Rhizohabitans arisaemae]
MRGWHGLDDVPERWGRSIVTIGVFDGVHRGHQRVLGRAVDLARENGRPAVVVTFDPHPDEVLQPGTRVSQLTSPAYRNELLAGLGVDAVCVLPFTAGLSRLGPEEFTQSVLVDRLHAAGVIVGEGFRFGHKASGTVETLRMLGEKHDFEVEAVPLLSVDRTVTSSRIRECVAAGKVEEATLALGRPHRVEGVVVRGHRRGRALGFPTANVESPRYTAIPADGVYAGWLRSIPVGEIAPAYDGERWPAAISIGTNPTFAGVQRTVEAYALDRDDLELYGVHVAVDFGARLRDTLKFDSIEALIEQMHRDVEQARDLTG